MKHNVTVLITVGPNPCYKKYLPEAVESVLDQSVLVNELLIIDDQALLDPVEIYPYWEDQLVRFFDNDSGFGMQSYSVYEGKGTKTWIRIWQTPWNIGFSQAFNCGVGLAANDLIIFLAADDKLLPDAVKDCVEAYEENNCKDAWYGMGYELQDGTQASAFNNVAMITKGLWKWTGGFPPSAFAAPDALLISCLLKHAPKKLVKVKGGKVNYWVRQHPNQETGRQAGYFMASGVVNTIRDLETKRFKPNPEWVNKR